MQKNEQDILDQFDEEVQRKWYHHGLVVYGPMLLLSIGLVFRVQHWPGARLILLFAMLMIMVRSFIFFLSSSRKWFEWIYFSSRITLMIALVYQFAWDFGNSTFMVFSLSFFSCGVLLYLFMTRKQTVEQPEREEDDY
jgi:hypothetical protein